MANDVVTYTDENGSVFSNTWDPMSRRTNTTIAPAAGIGGTTAQSFQYNGLGQTTLARDTANGNNADSINRLLQYQRGILNSTGGYQNNGGGGITAANALPGSNTQENWNLDGLGNWRATGIMSVGGSQTIDQRNHNYLNEITQSVTSSLSPVTFVYDGATGASNGNLKNDGTLIYAYDPLNRPIQINRVSDGLVIATYLYDAMNSRVRKTISNGGLAGNIPNETTDNLWQGWQTVEERDPFGGTGSTDTSIKQYIWGSYIDECIQLTTYTILGTQSLAAGAYYLLQDLLFRAVALTNSTGGIVEAYDTDAYGNTLIFTGPGADGIWFANDDVQSGYGANEIIYCGYRYDPETELYYVRNRTYRPTLGRWIQRDPIGYVGGVNLYEYVESNPVNAVDPWGKIAVPLPKSIPEAVAEAILAAILTVYLLYLARQAAKEKCIPRKRESGCELGDCDRGRPCGVEGSGRSCQWAVIITGLQKGVRQCGCYGGGPGDEE